MVGSVKATAEPAASGEATGLVTNRSPISVPIEYSIREPR